MAEINDLSTTDASNTARFPENMAPSAVNNGARALEGMIARWFQAQGGENIVAVADVGVNSLSVSLARASLTATASTSHYIDGLTLAFRMPSTITDTLLLSANGHLKKSTYKMRAGAAASLSSSDLIANQHVVFRYSNTLEGWLLLSSTARDGSVVGPTSATSGNLASFNGTDGLTLQDSGVASANVAQVGLQTIWVPAVAMYPRTTNGAATGSAESSTNKVMSKSLDFDTTTQEFAQFAIQFPKSWNEGTVTFQPVWTAASGSGGVVFGLAGVALSDDDAIDTAFGTAQTSTDTLITANDIHVGPASSAITIAGTPADGDWVAFQINRTVADGGDTLGVDARLFGVRLFFTTNLANDA